MSTPRGTGLDDWTWEPEEEPRPAPPPGHALRTALRITGSLLLAASVVVLAVLAWPHQAGGRFGTTVVVGHSMDGTYRTGDLLVTRSEPDYERGDVVVYTVSYEKVEGTVVHRIIDEQDGTFVTRGDNNPYPDPWPVNTSDVRGQVVLRIPALGWAVLLVRTPLALMLLTGVMVTYLLWPRRSPEEDPMAAPQGEPFDLSPPSGPPAPADTPSPPAEPAPTSPD